MIKRSWPHGRIGPNDDGQVGVGVACDPQHKVVVVHFQQAVTWFAMPLEQAEVFAKAINDKLGELRKISEPKPPEAGPVPE